MAAIYFQFDDHLKFSSCNKIAAIFKKAVDEFVQGTRLRSLSGVPADEVSMISINN